VHVDLPAAPAGPDSPARAGLVVSRAVGGSVVRSRTSRRLRHLLRDRLPVLPPGARLVVRAGSAAGGATSADLGRDLDAALRRLGLDADPADRASAAMSR
jgi:ribonuclease P protein component